MFKVKDDPPALRRTPPPLCGPRFFCTFNFFEDPIRASSRRNVCVSRSGGRRRLGGGDCACGWGHESDATELRRLPFELDMTSLGREFLRSLCRFQGIGGEGGFTSLDLTCSAGDVKVGSEGMKTGIARGRARYHLPHSEPHWRGRATQGALAQAAEATRYGSTPLTILVLVGTRA